MTNQELQRLVNKWQRRLRLADWKVTAVFADPSVMPEHMGEIPSNPSEMTALLRIAGDVEESEIEPTVIHELLHLRLIPWSDGFDDEPNHEARETGINLLAESFLRAFPKRKKTK